MALTDLAPRLLPNPHGPPCTVCLYEDGLPDDQRAALHDLYRDRSVRYTTLADAIRGDADYPAAIEHRTWARHIKGECRENRHAGVRYR